MECFKVRIEEVENGYFTVFSSDGNQTYYCTDSAVDAYDWCIEHNAYIVWTAESLCL